jgi:hypothetical protein
VLPESLDAVVLLDDTSIVDDLKSKVSRTVKFSKIDVEVTNNEFVFKASLLTALWGTSMSPNVDVILPVSIVPLMFMETVSEEDEEDGDEEEGQVIHNSVVAVSVMVSL